MNAPRLVPMVMLASVLLLGLKGLDIFVGFDALRSVPEAQAQEAEDAGGGGETSLEDNIAAAISASRQQSSRDGEPLELDVETSRDILLQRLGDRREVLEERERDMEIREQLLEAAERRLEERMAELEALEQQVNAVIVEEEAREQEEIARLVQVYGAMRAKDAAAIFDLLDLPILLNVAEAMNPRKMADILGNMNPEAARRLTIAMAGAATVVSAAPEPGSDLPQIQGVPVQ
ncbi:MAG: hypothetical protein KI785_01830 [Devosiaceae bacterium]|nr:hypothetical protein [Devosiaceae bacterium MH13]